MRDINKNTVDFRPNFDEHEMEPVSLPSRFPNFLVNGAVGIAVGMATNIPPHNLGEVIDGCIMMMNNPDVTVDELMNVVKGPDFPTGGAILGTSGIREAYLTGKGRIVVRAHAEIEDRAGKTRIIIHDIPYAVNKARLIERMADLVKEKKVEGISGLRDESDRNEQVRIVVELKNAIRMPRRSHHLDTESAHIPGKSIQHIEIQLTCGTAAGRNLTYFQRFAAQFQ